MVGTRSRAIRRRLSDNDIRCSASDRRWFPARPAQHVHGRRNNGKGQIHRHSRARMAETAKDGARHATPCNAGRAGAYRPSEALHPIRSSDVLPRIARERVPTMGIDLIPYVDARGRPPDRSDELIGLHRPQISKDLWAMQTVHFSSIHGFRRREFNVRLRDSGN